MHHCSVVAMYSDTLFAVHDMCDVQEGPRSSMMGKEDDGDEGIQETNAAGESGEEIAKIKARRKGNLNRVV